MIAPRIDVGRNYPSFSNQNIILNFRLRPIGCQSKEYHWSFSLFSKLFCDLSTKGIYLTLSNSDGERGHSEVKCQF